MPEQRFSNTLIFSIGHIAAFSHLETLDSTLALSLGAIFNSEITNRKHKNTNNMALNRPPKRILVYSMRAGIRRQSIISFLPQLGMCALDDSNFFAILCISVNDHKRDVSIDLGLQINFGKFKNTESRIMRINCRLPCLNLTMSWQSKHDKVYLK